MKQVIVVLIAVVVALLSFQYANLQRAKLKPLQAELVQAKDDLREARATTERYSKIIAANAADAQSRKRGALVAQKELNNAIKAEPDWASDTVPDSVWDALSRGSPRPN